jgi:hypothetical protein
VRFALAAALCSAGCTQNAQPVVLRSLEASGNFSSLCMGTRNPTATIPSYEPRNVQDCPDTTMADGEDRHAFSMVTQTTRGEVALVDLTLGQVADSEPTIPGYNFLTIGAQPTGIVSTPGSLATFVGVAEPGKEGIFALPTSCVGSRKPDAPLRDLTMWPACRLPSAPGELALIIDMPPDDTMPNVYRQHCTDTMVGPAVGQSPLDENGNPRICPADLSQETQQPGRRKLIVSLPDRVPVGKDLQDPTVDTEITRGTIAIIDAQDLLDRAPGTYEPCVFEKEISFAAYNPSGGTLTQVEPADLKAAGPPPAGLAHPQKPAKFTPKPGGFAQVEDETTKEHRLFVADLQAPVIHEIDTSDVCEPVEKEFLYPLSFADSNRVVTTTRLAASPLSIPPDGEPVTAGTRYLYAIDQFDNGSIMMFDVSPGATNRTPLLRTHAPLFPIEPPDRIAFVSPARDVAFALRDHVQVDPATGTQQIGRFCNPDPSIPLTDPGALYRPASDLSTGAAPNFLRGIFGFAALENGQVAVIDVQDFDAPCRRPIYANPSSTQDFRGCANDPVPNGVGGTFATSAGPTVTNEVTCSVVETNRDRSSAAIRNDLTLGTHAPSLRAFPTLISDTGRTLPTSNTPDGLKNPRMLGVDFSAKDKAQVWLGTTLYATGDPTNPLVIDPTKADTTSVVLSFVEPRIYASSESFTAVFEGITSKPRPSGRLTYENGVFTLDDSGATFCDFGVLDETLSQERAESYNAKDDPNFGLQHADYVEITSDLFPSDNDVYWTKGHAGASCGGADPNTPGAGFLLCQTQFGTAASPNTKREFRVVHASRAQLVIDPRGFPNSEKLIELTTCCFPADISYDVRASNEWVVTGSASGYQHNEVTITPNPNDPNKPWTGPDGTACALSNDALKSKLRGRALEVSCSGAGCPPAIGVAGPGDTGCVFPAGAFNPVLGDPGAGRCIFDGLKSNFVIYKGSTTSLKNYEYDWTVIGGFSSLSINLSATTDTNTSPLAMVYSPARGALLVADGSTKGIVTVDLSTLGISIIY